eukprot:gnl/MRDRNA2_/MRDRNA2_243017_c0_seq1.p1 gnl/MRDRNA2_/MRDRNA2_243017_c0~~gnl/MRDRNA2_/MRDRNA2_243017_c0_seq1.p1  ORF type:complete len:115 (-),score=12.27 gnl/MRDRNA2_/MRDRNA2_243017_c0_seq1:19-363(-)
MEGPEYPRPLKLTKLADVSPLLVIIKMPSPRKIQRPLEMFNRRANDAPMKVPTNKHRLQADVRDSSFSTNISWCISSKTLLRHPIQYHGAYLQGTSNQIERITRFKKHSFSQHA